VKPGGGGAKYLASLGVAAVGADNLVRGGDSLRAESGRVRSPPDFPADERHLHPGEHGHRGNGEGPGLEDPVHARAVAHHERGAGDHQPDRDYVAYGGDGLCEYGLDLAARGDRELNRE